MKRFRSWGQLRTVLTVAEAGSYRAAAAALGITNSTVARHIEAISEELGQPVFLPAGNRWELSKVGAELVSIIEETQVQLQFLLKDIENDSDSFASLRINTLSFVNSDYLSPAMRFWHKNYPDADVTIEANDETTAVERGEADVALRMTRPDTPGIARFKLANGNVRLYTPKNGDATAWVGLPKGLDDLPECVLARGHFGKHPAMRMDSYRAVAKASVATGLSCILPICMARDFPELQPISTESDPLIARRELWFLFYETRKNDPAILAAKTWVKQVFPSPNKCLCGMCG